MLFRGVVARLPVVCLGASAKAPDVTTSQEIPESLSLKEL